MRLSRRSFPHPVVGNGDDVPEAAFQATLEFSSDTDHYYVAVSIQCSSPTIGKLVENGDATYVLHVECSNTVFRRAYLFDEPNKKFTIPADQLHDQVEANVFVTAKKSIPSYRVKGAHSDYGNASFGISPGDILAVGEGQVFTADPKFDSLNTVGSIMQIDESLEDGEPPMKIDFGTDKIRIVLSKQDFASYKMIKQDKMLSGSVATAMVLPALMQALIYVQQEDSQFEDLRWCRSLRRRIESQGLNADADVLMNAQTLLEMPIKRALLSAQASLESNS